MKKLIVALGFIVLGGGALTLFRVIGSKVSPEGILVEPFFLLPIGYVLILVGFLMLLLTVMNLFKTKKKGAIL